MILTFAHHNQGDTVATEKKTGEKKKKTVRASGPNVPAGLEDLYQYLAVYERCRYGTIAPDDVTRPAADVSIECRKLHQDAGEVPDWGCVLLSLLVAMRRAGVDLRHVTALAEKTAEEWMDIGKESHPMYPDAPPPTDPDRDPQVPVS